MLIKNRFNKKVLLGIFILLFSSTTLLTVNHFLKKNNIEVESEMENEEEENEMYDGPDKAAAFQVYKTKDLSTGKVPNGEYWKAMMETKRLKENNNINRVNALTWTERGSYSDVAGPSGNSRPNGDVTSGRIRTIMVDSLDPTKKTVWVGGVDGGLWKTTDITTSPANWILVNDFLSNLAVSDICQDPSNPNTMYFATGESYFNADAVQGGGVFKSTDHGVTWNLLSSTASYVSNTRILCDFQGNVYLATRDNGLLRSNNGGTTWTTITPSGLGTSRICDMEISSTSGPARLHVVSGIFSAQAYRYTDNPTGVTSAAGWVAPTTGFTSATNPNQRAEIACSGNILYALPATSTYQVPVIYKSIDGGDNWSPTAAQPTTTNWASGQGWYALTLAINPVDNNQVIVGGLDCHRTLDGGVSWSKISTWVGATGQYVHADQHDMVWYDGGNKLIFACDGGIHFSSNSGALIRDRNIGLRLKQFYSCAIHPTQTNYFLAGAQDNGTHQFTNAGLGISTEVTGGDGAYTAIDQDEPQFQFGAYVYNQYRRSTNGGTSWSSINFSGSIGQFINPFVYDNTANKIYACYSAGNLLRWENPQTGNTTTTLAVAGLGTGQIGALCVSPFTSNRLYLGSTGGKIIQLDNADQAAPTELNITGSGMPTGYVNCISVGNSNQNLVACFSNYGVTNIWVSTNGGTTWTGIDGNLPNMPVNWAIFNPDDNTKMIIATETGVWETDLINGGSTVWVPNNTFPNVRVDMLQYRASDKTIAAATHGRGLWTTTIPNTCPPANITTQPTNANICTGSNASFSVVTSTGTFNYQWQVSTNGGVTFTNIFNGGIYSGVSTANLTITGAGILQNNYQYKCVITTTCIPLQTTISNAAILNVANGITITSQPSNVVICEGSNTSFTVGTSAAASAYQWQVSTNGGTTYTNLINTAPYSGISTATLTLTAPSASLNGNLYRCVLTSSCGNLTTNGATLTANALPLITLQPTSATTCAGNLVTFNTAATGTGISYQWQVSTDGGTTFNNVPTATTSTYSFNTALINNGYKYKCIITGTCATTITNTVTLTVNGTLVINTHPSNSTICAGNNTAFSVGVTGVVNNYQWQVSTNSGTTFTDILNGGIYSNATTNTLTLTGATFVQNGYQYRCVVTGSCPSINSNAAILTINTAPVIATQPAVTTTLCNGQNTTISIAANGTALTYQWQESSNGGTSFANISNGIIYGGTTTNTLTITNANTSMHTYQYRCIVSGTCTPSATSNNALLNVYTPVSITTQPLNAIICSTGNTSFIVAATGTNPSYQWQESTNNGTTFTNITSATSATLTLTNVAVTMHNNQYRCIVSGAAPCGLLISSAAILNVSAQPTINLSASPFTSLLPGLTTTLTATTSLNPSNVTYTWYKNNTTFTNNTNNYLVSVNNLGTYKVNVKDNINGCTNTSNDITIKDSISSRLFIYPSPNNGLFTVSYFNNGGLVTTQTITIFDAKGSLVYNNIFNVYQVYQLHQIDLRRNKSGIYYVIISDKNGKKITSGEVLVNK